MERQPAYAMKRLPRTCICNRKVYTKIRPKAHSATHEGVSELSKQKHNPCEHLKRRGLQTKLRIKEDMQVVDKLQFSENSTTYLNFVCNLAANGKAAEHASAKASGNTNLERKVNSANHAGKPEKKGRVKRRSH